jgi:MTH538 TIR-like domain (DUF1863)
MTHEPETIAPPESEGYKYWAFISYSHQDEEWAKWLHKSLETYRVPRKLVGRPSGHGEIPKKLFPIFRDRDELPGAADLGGRIKDCLSQSRSLIVICSPKSAASKWVNEEIKTYKTLGREDRVLCLIVDGEPNATDKPESGLLECFPPAVRFQVDAAGEVTDRPTEPIAADARPDKDGKTNALLKLLSGILAVGYDELKQREKQRRFWRRVQLSALAFALVFLTFVLYVGVADAGLSPPGGERIRTFLDRHEASLLRPVRSDTDIRRAAGSLRRDFSATLRQGQTPTGWIPANLKPGAEKSLEYWAHPQALSALFAAPEAVDAESPRLLAGLDVPFAGGATVEGSNGEKYGWMAHPNEQHTQAEPALWTATALADALARPGLLTGDARERALTHLTYTQEVLKTYRPVDDGGWNMFPNQDDPSLHNVYTTTLALLALLETRRANLPWEGSTEKRDQLLKAAAQWLSDRYDDKAAEPGWRTGGKISEATIDGLTLQIYAELLRAEAEAGFKIPSTILDQIPSLLAHCVERDLNFPIASGEFSANFTDQRGQHYLGREVLGFLWYPWAISAAQLWLQRAERLGGPVEDRVRMRRALGHLVINLGSEAVKKYKAEWTYQAAETLYGLSSIPSSSER